MPDHVSVDDDPLPAERVGGFGEEGKRLPRRRGGLRGVQTREERHSVRGGAQNGVENAEPEPPGRRRPYREGWSRPPAERDRQQEGAPPRGPIGERNDRSAQDDDRRGRGAQHPEQIPAASSRAAQIDRASQEKP